MKRNLPKSKIDEYIRSIEIPGYNFDLSLAEEVEDTDTTKGDDLKYTENDRMRSLFIFISIISIITTLWHLIWYVNPITDGLPFLALHLLLMGTILFLTTIKSKGDKYSLILWNGSTVFLIFVLIVSSIYVIIEYENFHMRAGAPSQMDVYVSTALILITIEGARRAYGNMFGVIGVVALIYGLFGHYFPGFLRTSGQSWDRLATGVVIPDLVGLYGMLLDLSAMIITIFIFFGVFLQFFGGAKFFGEVAIRLGSNLRSGPAQVSIVSSGLMGMINGTAVANVAATGAFTIPLMKEMGYDDDFAGAIESVASIGGQFTPPVMGAAAFIMASILGRPFIEIVVAASLPALLYYFTIMSTAHIRAVKIGLKPYDGEVVSLTSLLVRSYFFIPLLVIIYELMAGTGARSAALQGVFWLIGLYIAFTLLENREEPITALRESALTLTKSFDAAARTMAPLVVLLAMLSWIVQLLNTTGILNRIAAGLIFLGGGELLLVLLLAAFTSILFGFGAPTTAAYVIVALVGAPALVQLGVHEISAHLFVFYFAILSAITPPVAAACLVAAGISGGKFVPTCLNSMRIAFPAFILPFIWIFHPELVGDGTLVESAVTLIFIAVALLTFVSFSENHLLTNYNRFERVLSLVVSLLLLIPSMWIKLFGAGLLVMLVINQLRKIDINIGAGEKLSQYVR